MIDVDNLDKAMDDLYDRLEKKFRLRILVRTEVFLPSFGVTDCVVFMNLGKSIESVKKRVETTLLYGQKNKP